MKKFFLLFVLAFLMALTACGGNISTENTKHPSSVQYSYNEELKTFEDIMKYSTNVVEATLISNESFNDYVDVYVFGVDKDLTENTPDEIHMYDAYNDEYIVGHTYYLFLDRAENALYPHTIYTTVKKDLIIDITLQAETAIQSNENEVLESEISKIKTAVMSAIDGENIGEKVGQLAEVSTSANITSISSEADVIAEIRVSNELSQNIYTSSYSVELVALLKGPKNSIASLMFLPPDLDTNSSYYVFLKEDPENPESYYLFSRIHPIMETSAISAQALSLD